MEKRIIKRFHVRNCRKGYDNLIDIKIINPFYYLLKLLKFIKMSTKRMVTAVKEIKERGIKANKQYKVIDETPSYYWLDGIGKVAKTNFVEEGIVKETPAAKSSKPTLVVKCNARTGYKNITVGKEYVVEDTEKDGKTTYYHIINDAKASARYNSKFFSSPVTRTMPACASKVEKPAVAKEPEIKPGFCLCVEATLGLKAGSQYKVIKQSSNMVTIEDGGQQANFLKSRFRFPK